MRVLLKKHKQFLRSIVVKENRMRIIDSILGNTSDAQWQERVKTAQIDYLALNQWDAQKTACAAPVKMEMTSRYHCLATLFEKWRRSVL
jgi:hypothetical protein